MLCLALPVGTSTNTNKRLRGERKRGVHMTMTHSVSGPAELGPAGQWYLPVWQLIARQLIIWSAFTPAEGQCNNQGARRDMWSITGDHQRVKEGGRGAPQPANHINTWKSPRVSRLEGKSSGQPVCLVSVHIWHKALSFLGFHATWRHETRSFGKSHVNSQLWLYIFMFMCEHVKITSQMTNGARKQSLSFHMWN